MILNVEPGSYVLHTGKLGEPEIILADEPTGNLDRKTGEEIMDLLLQLNEEGRTIIIVTHDIEVANKCNRIIELVDGEIV